MWARGGLEVWQHAVQPCPTAHILDSAADGMRLDEVGGIGAGEAVHLHGSGTWLVAACRLWLPCSPACPCNGCRLTLATIWVTLGPVRLVLLESLGMGASHAWKGVNGEGAAVPLGHAQCSSQRLTSSCPARC